MNILKYILAFLMFFSAGFSAQADKTKSFLPYQKPGAPIRIAEPDFIQMAPNSEQGVIIKFITPTSGELFLTSSPKEGITLRDTASEWQFNLDQGQASVEFTIISGEKGLYHVMFHARIMENGVRSTRVFGIPVYVGEQQAVSNKNHPTHIIMKAEETVN